MIEHEIIHRTGINFNGIGRIRHAVRAVILKKDIIVLAYLENTNEYKFPGGGINHGESIQEALKREVSEEIGADIKEIRDEIAVITEYDKRDEDPEDYFKMISRYYLVEIYDELKEQKLDLYEKEFGFKPVHVKIEEAIRINKINIEIKHTKATKWIKRETYVLEKILEQFVL